MKVLASAGNVTVQSNDPDAEVGIAQIIADRFAISWLEGADESKPLGVDVDHVHYVVVPEAVN